MLSVALVDADIKDADIVAVFRAVCQLLLQVVNNPFLSLPDSFSAKPAKVEAKDTEQDQLTAAAAALRLRNEPVLEEDMFATGPEDIKPEWLSGSAKFTEGIERLGQLLSPASGRSSEVGVRA